MTDVNVPVGVAVQKLKRTSEERAIEEIANITDVELGGKRLSYTAIPWRSGFPYKGGMWMLDIMNWDKRRLNLVITS